jgi:hypothetical protein
LGDYEVDYLPMTMKITGFGPIEDAIKEDHRRVLFQ